MSLGLKADFKLPDEWEKTLANISEDINASIVMRDAIQSLGKTLVAVLNGVAFDINTDRKEAVAEYFSLVEEAVKTFAEAHDINIEIENEGE